MLLGAGRETKESIIDPSVGLIFEKKPIAAVYALNGFGKTVGGMQIEELGTLETPIALTNTLNVGKVADALVGYTCGECEKAGTEVQSVNPVVGETNDWRINRITRRVVGEKEVLQAIACADTVFEQGAVGAGTGTVCFGLKGGIGSASRRIPFGKTQYTLGALVQSNFGEMKDLSVCGDPVGKRIAQALREEKSEDKGSIMIVHGRAAGCQTAKAGVEALGGGADPYRLLHGAWKRRCIYRVYQWKLYAGEQEAGAEPDPVLPGESDECAFPGGSGGCGGGNLSFHGVRETGQGEKRGSVSQPGGVFGGQLC